jgi:glycine dehydrogenase subunit 2
MITNPNTCGLFEPDMIAISEAVHAAGGLVYCDGANFNAIVGPVRPGDLGIDAMHINLHKTFSTPHGGGGPGSGPVVFSEALTPFAPLPFVERQAIASIWWRRRAPASIISAPSAGWSPSTARWACSPAP